MTLYSLLCFDFLSANLISPINPGAGHCSVSAGGDSPQLDDQPGEAGGAGGEGGDVVQEVHAQVPPVSWLWHCGHVETISPPGCHLSPGHLQDCLSETSWSQDLDQVRRRSIQDGGADGRNYLIEFQNHFWRVWSCWSRVLCGFCLNLNWTRLTNDRQLFLDLALSSNVYLYYRIIGKIFNFDKY